MQQGLKVYFSYFPFQMDPTGNQVILGYADGVVRLFALETESDTKSTGSSMYKLTKALSARYVLHLKILFKKSY